MGLAGRSIVRRAGCARAAGSAQAGGAGVRSDWRAAVSVLSTVAQHSSVSFSR